MRCLLRSVGIDASVVYLWGGCTPSTVDYFSYGSWWGPSFRVVLAAHDNAPPNPHFTFHAVTESGGTCYDPSYGTTGMVTLDETAPSGVPYWEAGVRYPTHANPAVRQTGMTFPPESIHHVEWTCPH